ncbi:TIGR02444 family protein [Pseudomonas benzenivorans]|nr:TIGR02444 family protein [Pseudomonas benzenivorans]SDH06740.1 TIGR02444 family protein [Pseudomonas benzenivorans]
MPADLWHFANDFYQRPGVEAACLQLQAQGADVCLLLCAAWLGRRGVACNAARSDCLRAAAEPWQRGVVSVLRQIRQDWRTAARHDGELAALREQLKRLELEAERVQLQRLAALSAAWPAEAAEDVLGWLEELAPRATDRDALQRLRVAALRP